MRSLLQCCAESVAVCGLKDLALRFIMALRCVVVWCSVLQCVVVCCSVWQSVAVRSTRVCCWSRYED